MSILQMLEEHSGGNYPFPRLDPMRTTNENNRNENTSSIFLRQSKYLSNSAESLNMMKQSPNIIEPSRYYHVEEQHHGIHRNDPLQTRKYMEPIPASGERYQESFDINDLFLKKEASAVDLKNKG